MNHLSLNNAECWNLNWTPAFWPNACLTLRTLLMLSDQAKKAFYVLISILYYYQPPLTVRHLQLQLPSSPPTRDGVDCGMLHLIKVSRALVLFNPSSRSYVVQVHAFNKCSLCDRDVPLNTSCLQHACDVHPDETNISYEHLRSLLSTADSIDSMDSILNLSKTLSNIHTLWSVKSFQL